MRTPKYLSPTSVSLWQQDIELFYSRYLADNKLPRDPQTKPMSIGSSFDAYAKSYLHEKLYGKGADPQYDLQTLFEEQVSEYNRDWAWENGKYVFEEYKKAGCFADLLLELGKSIGKPRFEFTISDDVSGVPLLGKPDIFFINEEGARVVYDWKVNGYCRAGNTSPAKGYVKLRPGNKVHRDCHLMQVNGIFINVAIHLEDVNQGWANQLSIYSWLLGEGVGSQDVIFGIDQICGPKNKLRFATHRLRVTADYQFELLALIRQIWEIIESGWIFRDMVEEESLARQVLLDNQCIDSDFERCM